uniref:Putative nucleotide-diphospho-sugar transferase, Plant galacturonosyltransferase GAUT n=1 Tax=Helianthus annuus TaxID=4232 RepID=A0A251T0X4_HELAN
MIMARVYMSIATMKNKTQLAHELQSQLKESQRALGDATADADLNHSVAEKIKAMGQLLSKLKNSYMILEETEHVFESNRCQNNPKRYHCLSLRLTIDYYLLPLEKRVFPRRENLENPDLYHYALFSDNVLAASVVVNSTIKNAKEPEKHVFHLVSDKLNFGAMNMWFYLIHLARLQSMWKMSTNSNG